MSMPVLVQPLAEGEIRRAVAHYLNEGGEALAGRFNKALRSALMHIAAHPKAGAMRYAVSLNLPGLRFWPLNAFPYLIFYVEGERQIEIWRVLHAQRDIPAWMGDP